jgi:hypothetical protein
VGSCRYNRAWKAFIRTLTLTLSDIKKATVARHGDKCL